MTAISAFSLSARSIRSCVGELLCRVATLLDHFIEYGEGARVVHVYALVDFNTFEFRLDQPQGSEAVFGFGFHGGFGSRLDGLGERVFAHWVKTAVSVKADALAVLAGQLFQVTFHRSGASALAHSSRLFIVLALANLGENACFSQDRLKRRSATSKGSFSLDLDMGHLDLNSVIQCTGGDSASLTIPRLLKGRAF